MKSSTPLLNLNFLLSCALVLVHILSDDLWDDLLYRQEIILLTGPTARKNPNQIL
jgi:hypothetical protein